MQSAFIPLATRSRSSRRGNEADRRSQVPGESTSSRRRLRCRPTFLNGYLVVSMLVVSAQLTRAGDLSRSYDNKLTPIKRPKPLLADHPEWVEPVRETNRWEAPAIVNDPDADLHVRAWRWSYNARGIIEIPNHLRASQTAIVMVHPWGIDDGQGWDTPEPAGVADFCTPAKNHLAAQHTRDVINPFLKALRGKVA